MPPRVLRLACVTCATLLSILSVASVHVDKEEGDSAATATVLAPLARAQMKPMASSSLPLREERVRPTQTDEKEGKEEKEARGGGADASAKSRFRQIFKSTIPPHLNQQRRLIDVPVISPGYPSIPNDFQRMMHEGPLPRAPLIHPRISDRKSTMEVLAGADETLRIGKELTDMAIQAGMKIQDPRVYGDIDDVKNPDSPNNPYSPNYKGIAKAIADGGGPTSSGASRFKQMSTNSQGKSTNPTESESETDTDNLDRPQESSSSSSSSSSSDANEANDVSNVMQNAMSTAMKNSLKTAQAAAMKRAKEAAREYEESHKEMDSEIQKDIREHEVMKAQELYFASSNTLSELKMRSKLLAKKINTLNEVEGALENQLKSLQKV